MRAEYIAPARQNLAGDAGGVHGGKAFVHRLDQFGEKRPDLWPIIEMDRALAVGPMLQRQPEILGPRLQGIEQVRRHIVGVNIDGHCGCLLTNAARVVSRNYGRFPLVIWLISLISV